MTDIEASDIGDAIEELALRMSGPAKTVDTDTVLIDLKAGGTISSDEHEKIEKYLKRS